MSFSPQGCVTCLPGSIGDGAFRQATRSWLDEDDPELARFRKAVLATARVVAPDRHGRLVLPPKLVEFAGLGRVINWIGDESSFEIWDATRWDAGLDQLDMKRMEGRFNTAMANAADSFRTTGSGGGKEEG